MNRGKKRKNILKILDFQKLFWIIEALACEKHEGEVYVLGVLGILGLFARSSRVSIILPLQMGLLEQNHGREIYFFLIEKN